MAHIKRHLAALLVALVIATPVYADGVIGNGYGVWSLNGRQGQLTLLSSDVSGAGGLLTTNALSELVGSAATARGNISAAPLGCVSLAVSGAQAPLAADFACQRNYTLTGASTMTLLASTGYAGITGNPNVQINPNGNILTLALTSGTDVVVYNGATGSAGAVPTLPSTLTNIWISTNGTGTFYVTSQAAGGGSILASNNTFSGTNLFSANGALSSGAGPAFSWTGTPITGGSGTANVPLAYFDCLGSTNPSTWSANGTFLGINSCTGFTGNYIDFRLNGATTAFLVTSGGSVTAAGSYIAGSTGVFSPSTRSKLSSPADGVWLVSNNAVSGFTRLDIGGTTSSFGALQTNGTETDSELADGSALAPFGASVFHAGGVVGVTCATGLPTSSFAAVGGIVTHC